MADDELIAELVDVLDGLVEEGALELSNRRAARSIAGPLLVLLERRKDADLGEWLVERPEVSELYAESDVLRARFDRVVRRMHESDDEPRQHVHPELAAAIVENLDDVQARVVYGDWLSEQGDPRGELVAVQARLAEHPEDQALRLKEATLMRRWRRRFRGDFIDEPLVFRWGFVDEAILQATRQIETTLRELAALESSRFLRRLVIRGGDQTSTGAALAAQPPPESLRELVIGDVGTVLGTFDVAHSTARLPRLVRLEVFMAHVDIGVPALPAVEHLVCSAETLTLRQDSFAAAPNLRELALDATLDASFDDATRAALLALFASPPPKLTAFALGMRPGAPNPAIRDALFGSPLLAQIGRLALWRTVAGEQGAAAADVLLAARGKLAHLESLDLSSCTTIPSDRHAALASLCKDVRLPGDETPMAWRAPQAVAEEEYEEQENEDDDDERYDDVDE